MICGFGQTDNKKGAAMKSVIERLDDIENTARSIVAKEEEDKSQVEQEISGAERQFDKELDEEDAGRTYQNPGKRKAAGR